MPGVGQSAVIGFFFLMALLIPMAASSFLDMILAGHEHKIEASLLKQARVYEEKNRKDAKEAEKNYGVEIAAIQAGWDKDKERINELSRTIDERLDQDPLAVDLAVYSELFLGMCQIKNYNDPEASKACGLRAAEAGRSKHSPIVSITSKTIDDWAALCSSTGHDDYCNPRAIAFRVDAMKDLTRYLPDVRKVLAELSAGHDTMREQIQTIMDMPETEISID